MLILATISILQFANLFILFVESELKPCENQLKII